MTTIEPRSRLIAISQGLLVVSLWSSSWVLIKFGLRDLPPLTFAGLRYVLAFVVLVPFALSSSRRGIVRGMSRRSWLTLAALGVLLYAVGVGAQFVALSRLPAVTTRLVFSASTIIVALLSGFLLRERPAWLQWCGVVVALLGGLLYFYPVHLPRGELVGIAVALLGAVSYALAAIVGRHVARPRSIPPLVITAVSMGVGSLLLLACGVAFQGVPSIGLKTWGIIVWLSVVNTSFTFVLWNRTLQTLTAIESNIISNAMVVFIAVLAWIFLGERLTVLDQAGLGLVIAGAFMVQVRRR